MQGTRQADWRKRALLLCLLLLFPVGHARADDAPGPARLAPLPQQLDVMVCLDTSITMEGLRDGFRDALWRLTIDFYSEQPNMDFRLGLLRYGAEGGPPPRDAERGPRGARPRNAPAEGRPPVVLKNLTLDFDAISDSLDRVQLQGGREHVAAALETALREADWKRGATRMLILAGNESPHQDPDRDTLAICRRARARGITVHALYCGGADDLHAPAWRELAEAGSGRFGTYDLEIPRRKAHVPTPFDRTLADLSGRLTATYLHDAARRGSLDRMRHADRRAAERSLAVSADRAVARALRPVDPDADLVARHVRGKPVLAEQLPPRLQALSPDARAAALDARMDARSVLRTRIRALAAERTRWEQARRSRDQRGLDAVLHALVTGSAPLPR